MDPKPKTSRDDDPAAPQVPTSSPEVPPEGLHHPGGTGIGAVTGGVIGGLIGAVAGPVTAVVGAAAGAIVGGNTGLNAAEAVNPETPEKTPPEPPPDIGLSPPRDNLDTGGFSSEGQRQVLSADAK